MYCSTKEERVSTLSSSLVEDLAEAHSHASV
jgi:hypothetical protein